jgi:hypothetical protein
VTDVTADGDHLNSRDRIYLEKLRLAVEVLLREAEDPGGIPDTLESELYIYRDQVDRVLLGPDPH